MTMTVVHCEADRARLMTDSARYTPNGRHLFLDELKTAALPGMPAAVTASGGTLAGERWKSAAVSLARNLPDFAAFLESAGALLARIRGAERLHAYAIGYTDGRFRGFVAWPGEGFADLGEGLHVRPAPAGVEPTAIERRFCEANGLPAPPDGAPLEAPGNVGGWAKLAKRIHADRACADITTGRKVLMGGDVVLTTLTPDGTEQKTIHRFSAAATRRMVQGTYHPHGQHGPCPCGSGQRHLDCHIPKLAHLPCLCGSGTPSGDCCALLADLEPATG